MKNCDYYMKHEGVNGCGGVVFYLTKKLKYGNPLSEDVVVGTNGEKAKAGEKIYCGSCGYWFKDGGLNPELSETFIYPVKRDDDGLGENKNLLP